MAGAFLGWCVAAVLCLTVIITADLQPVTGGLLGVAMGAIGVLVGDELDGYRR